MQKFLFTAVVMAGLVPSTLMAQEMEQQPVPEAVPPQAKPMVVQPPAPEPEPQGLWPMGRREEERRLNPNQTVRPRAKLQEQMEPKPRIKLGDPAQ